ncbi:unnamed protein product [Heligmosomoides polygyrus]|uniref:Uncharacterized protein n=1 Tax=Heligmosomoides polygyrus TaxID=6339 RepID=A0A183GQK3_HELPZ|nr:unnamed protein product [Heligmosomoides polygyrus]
MLVDLDRVCGSRGLQLSVTKTMCMRNGRVFDALFSLNGTNISECSSCVYLVEVNVADNLAPEEQEETSSLRSFQERRRSPEEDCTTPYPPTRLRCSSCANIRLIVRDLSHTRAG